MISPARRLPAASILQVSAIAVRRVIDIDHRNTAMQFFYMKLTVSLFYWLLFYATDQRALGQKVCFFSEYLCFFLAVASNLLALTPAIRQYIFPRCHLSESSSCFGMISDEGSGGAIIMVVVGGEEGV